MKRKFSISVDVDLESYGISQVQFPGSSQQPYVIQVRSDCAGYGLDPVAVVAHEIGHAVAQEFGLPGRILDSRRVGSPFYDSDDEQLKAEAVIPCEEEAWDIADAIVPVAPNQVKAIATYRSVAARLLVRPRNSGNGWIRLP